MGNKVTFQLVKHLADVGDDVLIMSLVPGFVMHIIIISFQCLFHIFAYRARAYIFDSPAKIRP